MKKPIPNIIHKSGKRDIVYYDDYKRLLDYCDELKKVLFEAGKQIYDQPLLESKIEDILD